MNEKLWNAAQNTFLIERDALQYAAAGIEQEPFLKAVAVLATAPRIGASGCGHTGIACRHFAHLMCCIERPARFLPPSEAVHGAMGFLQAGDAMLLASRGGKTSELIAVMEICKQKRVTLIAATENLRSPLAQGADVVLQTLVTRETDRHNSQGTTSFTVLNVLFDALQSALIEATDFCNARFALNHPGGAVGERLNAAASSGTAQQSQ